MHECTVASHHDRFRSPERRGTLTEWVVLGVGVNLLLPGTQQSHGDSAKLIAGRRLLS